MFSCTSCLLSHTDGDLVKCPAHSGLVMVRAVVCAAGTVNEKSDLVGPSICGGACEKKVANSFICTVGIQVFSYWRT